MRDVWANTGDKAGSRRGERPDVNEARMKQLND
jgi:hypothetical protein